MLMHNKAEWGEMQTAGRSRAGQRSMTEGQCSIADGQCTCYQTHRLKPARLEFACPSIRL